MAHPRSPLTTARCRAEPLPSVTRRAAGEPGDERLFFVGGELRGVVGRRHLAVHDLLQDGEAPVPDVLVLGERPGRVVLARDVAVVALGVEDRNDVRRVARRRRDRACVRRDLYDACLLYTSPSPRDS